MSSPPAQTQIPLLKTFGRRFWLGHIFLLWKVKAKGFFSIFNLGLTSTYFKHLSCTSQLIRKPFRNRANSRFCAIFPMSRAVVPPCRAHITHAREFCKTRSCKIEVRTWVRSLSLQATAFDLNGTITSFPNNSKLYSYSYLLSSTECCEKFSVLICVNKEREKNLFYHFQVKEAQSTEILEKCSWCGRYSLRVLVLLCL